MEKFHSFKHSFTHSLIHLYTHSLTHAKIMAEAHSGKHCLRIFCILTSWVLGEKNVTPLSVYRKQIRNMSDLLSSEHVFTDITNELFAQVGLSFCCLLHNFEWLYLYRTFTWAHNFNIGTTLTSHYCLCFIKFLFGQTKLKTTSK